jgi:hypothetical protein
MTFEFSLIYQVLAKLERVRNGRRLYSLDVFSLREHSRIMANEEWPIQEPYFFIGPGHIFSPTALFIGWLLLKQQT